MERTADGRLHTTEWEDIQYKHGNKVGLYRDHEIDIVAQKLADMHPDCQLGTYDPVAERAQEKAARGGFDGEVDLDAIGGEDDDGPSIADDDDEVLAAFRRRRLDEIKRQAAVNRFGRLRQISGPEYVEEITKASETAFVVAVLMERGNADCDAILQVFGELSSRHRDVKFVAVPATEAIPGFPARHLPCVLIYKGAQMKHQTTGLDAWGGKHMSLQTCSRVLGSQGVIAVEEERDDEGEDEVLRRSKYYMDARK